MHSFLLLLWLLLLVETTGFGFRPPSSSSLSLVVRSQAISAETRLYVSMGSLEENFVVAATSLSRRKSDSGAFVSSSSSRVATSATVLPPLQKKEQLKIPTQTTSSSLSASEYAWSAKVAKRVFAANCTSPVLLFDGVCNLCNEAVILCLDWDDAQVFRFASLQSQVGRALLIQTGRDPDDRSTMVLVRRRSSSSSSSPNQVSKTSTSGSALELSCHTGSDAVLLLAAELQGLPRLLRWSAKVSMALVPPFLREAVMKVVSANRHLLGESDGPQCRLDLDGVYESRFLDDLKEEEDINDARSKSS